MVVVSSCRKVFRSVGKRAQPHEVFYMSLQTAHPLDWYLRILVWGVGGRRDDVRSAWPSDALGYTRATMAGYKGFAKSQDGANPIKPASVRIGGCNSPP
jgi:hypothetical protein